MSLAVGLLLVVLIEGGAIASSPSKDTIPCENPPSKLILLRHACKLNDSPDSPLCPAGWAQAGELIYRLENDKPEHIYQTTRLRSQQTAHFLAKSRGVVPEPKVDDTSMAAADLIKNNCKNGKWRGEVILYVGHSDTLPGAYGALGLTDPESTYGNGSVITFEGKHAKPPEPLTASKIECEAPCFRR